MSQENKKLKNLLKEKEKELEHFNLIINQKSNNLDLEISKNHENQIEKKNLKEENYKIQKNLEISNKENEKLQILLLQ